MLTRLGDICVWFGVRAVMERDNVGSLGEIHNDRVVHAVDAVIFGELATQSAGLNADHGIKLGIEIIGATENLRRNLIFLDGGARVIESVFCEITKEFAERF